MSNVTVQRLGDEAQMDNDPHRLDYIRRDQYDKPIATRVSAAEIRAYGLVGGIGALLLLLVLWLLRVASCWNVSDFDPAFGCRAASGLLWLYIVALVAAAVATPVLLIWSRVQRTRAEAYRARITRDRYSNPVDAMTVINKPLEMNWRELLLATQAEIVMAPHKALPAGLDSLSINSSNQSSKTEPALLPDSSLSLVPSDTWRSWLDRTPHIMLAGRTDAGKTTMAQAILADRILGGDEILICDPHDQPEKWFGIQSIGGGRGFSAILSTFDLVLAEMDARYKEYTAGKKTEDFTRLTVLIDEVPALVAQCMDLKTRKPKDLRWLKFANQLGSEARKVRISVVLLTQSPLVQDIGINTAMRENFTRIALGDQARPLLNEEKNPKLNQTLNDLLRGRPYPAAMEYRGEFHVLNNDDVPDLARRRVADLVKVWEPPVCLSENSKNPDSWVSEQTQTQTDGQARPIVLDYEDKIALLMSMRRGGRTREEARQRLAAMGEGLDNDDWAEVGRRLGL